MVIVLHVMEEVVYGLDVERLFHLGVRRKIQMQQDDEARQEVKRGIDRAREARGLFRHSLSCEVGEERDYAGVLAQFGVGVGVGGPRLDAPNDSARWKRRTAKAEAIRIEAPGRRPDNLASLKSILLLLPGE